MLGTWWRLDSNRWHLELNYLTGQAGTVFFLPWPSLPRLLLLQPLSTKSIELCGPTTRLRHLSCQFPHLYEEASHGSYCRVETKRSKSANTSRVPGTVLHPARTLNGAVTVSPFTVSQRGQMVALATERQSWDPNRGNAMAEGMCLPTQRHGPRQDCELFSQY